MTATRLIDVAGRRTRLAETGPAGAPAIVLLPPGLYGTGTLGGLVDTGLGIWGEALPALAARRRVVALDTPGQGGTEAGAAEPSLDEAIGHLAAFLDAAGLRRPHLVGHDEGAMVAIRLALRDPSRVASVTLVSCPSVAPTGDNLNPLFLANPLEPRLSAQGQRWAVEQVSDSPHHLTADWLEAAVAAAASPGASSLRARLTEGDAGARLAGTLAKAKMENFARLRDEGLKVPAAILWGLNDPVAGRANATALLDLIAARQPAAQMHLLNRAGYFAYREQPGLFAALVAGFVTALESGR